MSSYRWFRQQVRVRYEETDQMGVVYHANYLIWFEIGRTELIRQIGYPYHRLEEQGMLLPVVEAELKYKRPARYDDVISIYTRIETLKGIRIGMAYEIRREEELAAPWEEGSEPRGELLVVGSTLHTFINKDWKFVNAEKEAPELWARLRDAAQL
ncbi:acyl-CoA thioesterase [Paenibacillus athensensis]|uniref:Uncharacterized protein n=1 Tax=Paenibacillus athensensis TaxID=1967502 RepID=A0A4Y8Q9B2_9BACL|nr:thioesterase family protein [Paenibacillus athensensis]